MVGVQGICSSSDHSCKHTARDPLPPPLCLLDCTLARATVLSQVSAASVHVSSAAVYCSVFRGRRSSLTLTRKRWTSWTRCCSSTLASALMWQQPSSTPGWRSCMTRPRSLQHLVRGSWICFAVDEWNSGGSMGEWEWEYHQARLIYVDQLTSCTYCTSAW